jgi:hypothetical protein
MYIVKTSQGYVGSIDQINRYGQGVHGQDIITKSIMFATRFTYKLAEMIANKFNGEVVEVQDEE